MSVLSRNRRRRSEIKRPLYVLLSGVGVIGLLLIMFAVAVRAPNGVPFVPYRTVYASVPDPGNIAPHNDVRIAGVRVGQVINLTSRDQRALVKLQLDPGQKVPNDTSVFVRGQGLLGARFVELRPGTSKQALPDGATIRGGAQSLTYGVPDALNTFDGKTRVRLSAALSGLGEGVLGRGRDLNAALHAAPPDGRDFQTVTGALLARPGAAGRLAPSLESTTMALDASREDMARGLAPTAKALQPLVDQRDALARTLEEAPPTLDVARSGLTEGRRLLGAARTLAAAASDTLPAAPPGLRATTALLRQSHAPLGRAASLLREAQPTVPAVLDVVHRASPLLEPARRLLDKVLPVVRSTGAHGCDIHNFGKGWRSLLGFGAPGPGPQSTPLPNGLIGPLDALRITPVVSTSTAQGIATDPKPLAQYEPYSPPCKYAKGSQYFAPLQNRAGPR